jgi:hypothetical protein
MDDPEEPREEWEKELRDVQHGITFSEGLRSTQIIAKRLSASPAPISDFAHLVRLFLSGTFLVIGFLAFSSDIAHRTALGVAALAAGCCLGIAAFRWPRQRG